MFGVSSSVMFLISFYSLSLHPALCQSGVATLTLVLDGALLVVGCDDGSVYFVDPDTLAVQGNDVVVLCVCHPDSWNAYAWLVAML